MPASSANSRGTACGRKRATALIHAASLAFRSIGTRQSAATRNRGKARLTQNAAEPARTSQISEETPPGRRSSRTAASEGANPERTTKAVIAGSGRSLDERLSSVSAILVGIRLYPCTKDQRAQRENTRDLGRAALNET